MASMRTIGVKLRMETGEYKADATAATAATKGLKGELDNLGTKGKANLDTIARGMSLAGVALLGVAGAAVAAALGFDKQMSEVGAVAGATAEQLGDLRQAAIDAGQATSFSASEAAKAEAELAKAGISTADILGGALSGALSLAAAGSLDLAEAATISANAMNTFGLSGADVGHIADVLAAAANKSAADVHDLGLGLSQVGLVANQVGFSLEETVGLLAAFADRGLKGSDGATSLKTALQRLAAPTDTAASKMRELGISMYDQNGQMVSAVNISGQLQSALADLTPAQRNAALQTIFGSDAIRAANVLYKEGSAGIQDYINAVNDQGAAGDVAAKKLDNLAGDVEKLSGSLETLAIGAEGGANGGLRFLVQTVDGLVHGLSSLPAPVQSGAVVIAGLSGAALLAAAGALKLKSTIGDVLGEMAKTGPTGTRMAGVLGNVASFATKAAGALVTLQIAGAALDTLTKSSADTQALAESLEHLGKSGQVSGELERLFGSDLKGFGDQAATASAGVSKLGATLEELTGVTSSINQGLFGGSFSSDIEHIKAVDDALANLVRGGNLDQALQIAQKLARANNMAFSDVEKALPGFAAAEHDAILAMHDHSEAADGAAAKTKDLSGAMDDASASADGLINKWKELHGGVLTADEALLAAKKAVDDVAQSFKDNGGAIQGNSEKALDNRVAMEKAAEAASVAAQRYFDLTGDLDGATKIMNDQKVAAEKAAIANGGNAKQVDILADSLFKLPPNKSVPVSTPGVSASTTAVDQLARKLGDLKDQTVNIDVVTRYSTIGSPAPTGRIIPNQYGGVYEHAAAGVLRDADVYGPTAPARYAFAEPSTGGEAFVPKYGSYGRSMSILSRAASWYGAAVTPAGGSGRVTTHRIVLEGTGMLAGLRREIEIRGGDVQVNLGPAPRRP